MFLEQDNLAIVRTELDEVFYQQYNSNDLFPGIATAETGAIFKVVPTTHAQYIGEIYGDTGYWSETGEIQAVAEATPTVSNKYTVSVIDFTQGIALSKDLFDDNMHNVWAETVKKFAINARATQNRKAFSLFNGMFTTTLTADGVAAISASHPLLAGGTQSNIISGALSSTTLNTAIVRLGEMKTQGGIIAGAISGSMILLVPSTLFNQAIQITESVLISDTANNATNKFYRSMLGIEVWTSPYLGATAGGSDTAWFLMSSYHSVSRLTRQGIETALTPWQYSKNRTYFYQGNYRESYYVPDYFGLVGSTGV